MALGEFTHLAANDQRHRLLRIAAVDYPTWQDQHLAGGRKSTITPWEAVLAGLTLSLPTFKQYRERVATIIDGAQQEAVPPIDHARSAIAGREIRVGATS